MMTEAISTDALDKALKFDPLASAEELTGKSYKEDDSTSCLGMALAMSHNASLRTALEEIGDTTMSMGLREYVSVIERAGFVKGYEKPFADMRKCIYTMGGFVIFFDTFTWDGTESETINHCKIYYNVAYPESMWEDISRAMSSGHSISGDNGERILVGDHDGRQAVLHTIGKLQAAGTVLDKWVETPFLWFLHHLESKDDGYDYSEINREVLKGCTKDVRDIIGAVS